MKKLICFALAVILLLSLAACQLLPPKDDVPPEENPQEQQGEQPEENPQDQPEVEDGFRFTKENMPVIDGSTATIPLIEALYSVALGVSREEAAEMFETSGTDNAYINLVYERGPKLLLVYAPSQDSLAEAEYNNVELEMAPIGRDGLVFLVNAANHVDNLSAEQVVDIYSGNITNWKDLGGVAGEIKAFQRPQRSGSQTMMDALVMKGIAMMPAEPQYVISEMGGLVDAVATFDNADSAIGYNVFYYVTRMKLDENVKLLSIDGVAPSVESISSGAYPFVNDFYAVIRADSPEGSPERLLFDWIQSADGQAMVKSEGYPSAG